MSELEIRKAVKERYAKLATSPSEPSCCDDDACRQDSPLISLDSSIPDEASTAGAGCGSPITLVDLKAGDAVLDLGSGGGADVFRASQMVGPGGKAINIPARMKNAGASRAKMMVLIFDKRPGAAG